MALTYNRPWTGIGEDVADAATVAEVLNHGLNWQVAKVPLVAKMSPSEEIEVTDHFYLVREDTRELFGVCGKEYVPTQNAVAIDFFDKFCKAGSMSMETAGLLSGGRQVWVLASLNRSFVLPGDDEVKGYLLLSQPHIWGKALTLKFTGIRVICKNTFTAAMNEESASWRMPHVRAFDEAARVEAEQALGLASSLLGKYEQVSSLLARTRIDEKVKVAYIAHQMEPDAINEAFGSKFMKRPYAERIVELAKPTAPKVNAAEFGRNASRVLSLINASPGADMASAEGTLWGAFNGITNFVDYEAGRSTDARINSAWFGANAVLKKTSLQVAADLAAALAA